MVASAEVILERFADSPHLVLAGDGVTTYGDCIRQVALSKGYDVKEAVVSGDWHTDSDDERSNVWTLAPEMPFLAFDAARIAVSLVLQKEMCKPQEITAFYVRQSDAELKLGGKRQ